MEWRLVADLLVINITTSSLPRPWSVTFRLDPYTRTLTTLIKCLS